MRKFIIRFCNFIKRTLETHPVYLDIKFSMPNSSLKDVKCVVTGGAKGIGLAISKKITESGGNVIITGRDEKALISTQKSLGPNCKYIVFDFTDFKKYDLFIRQVKDLMPDVNSMVFNAGISLHETSFEDVTFDSFDKQLATNLKTNYFLAQYYIKEFKKGNLIFVSSETADMKCLLPYGLTKSAINSFVAALSCKYYRQGLRVNAVAPGVTITNMVKNPNVDSDNYYCNNMSGRYFLPEEVAETVSFLLSDVSKSISGEVIHTNAGNHYRPQ